MMEHFMKAGEVEGFEGGQKHLNKLVQELRSSGQFHPGQSDAAKKRLIEIAHEDLENAIKGARASMSVEDWETNQEILDGYVESMGTYAKAGALDDFESCMSGFTQFVWGDLQNRRESEE